MSAQKTSKFVKLPRNHDYRLQRTLFKVEKQRRSTSPELANVAIDTAKLRHDSDYNCHKENDSEVLTYAYRGVPKYTSNSSTARGGGNSSWTKNYLNEDFENMNLRGQSSEGIECSDKEIYQSV